MSKIRPGFYAVNKPQGWTSFDVVNKLKHLSGEKKIGHAGSLDPMATGVLVIAIGKIFTKQIDSVMGMNKIYLAEITLGIETDSYDLEGKVTAIRRSEWITQPAIEAILPEFQGDILQKPPIYSAIKKKGRKLYEYARKDIEVEIELRPVRIESIEILSFSPGVFPKVLIKAEVSKGTYMRSLAHDMGEKLGTFGVLSQLERIAVGSYGIKDAYGLDRFQAMVSTP
jgi:tRNA pseudouridine55 synthase